MDHLMENKQLLNPEAKTSSALNFESVSPSGCKSGNFINMCVFQLSNNG